MCDSASEALPPLPHDEYVLGTDRVRGFVSDVRGHIGAAGSPAEACDALGPLFSDLLADDTWLPVAFQEPVLDSGMGGGIGQWLLFRAADRSLSLFSLVVPPGSMTPVHDHLAWGLVGLYRGNQDEEFYRPRAGGLDLAAAGRSIAATSTPCSRRRTTSTASVRPPEVTSVSIHLLANDTGCVARHTFDEQTGEARPFRSGYVNAECTDG